MHRHLLGRSSVHGRKDLPEEHHPAQEQPKHMGMRRDNTRRRHSAVFTALQFTQTGWHAVVPNVDDRHLQGMPQSWNHRQVPSQADRALEVTRGHQSD